MRRVVAAFVVTSLAGLASASSAPWSIKLASGRFDPVTWKHLGNSRVAKAVWTKKEALDGRFSVLLSITGAPFGDPAFEYPYAAAVVDGVQGMTVGDLGTISFASKGDLLGGAPRFNLFYDVDGDGAWDDYRFFEWAGGVATPLSGGWTQYDFTATTPPYGTAIPADAKVVSLSVLVDLPGTYYVDRITAGGITVGEPSGRK